MNSNQFVLDSKQHRVKSYVRNNDSYDFFNLLTSDSLLTTVEDLLPEHRERLFPPTETLSMFLAQVLNTDSSCQNAVNEAAVKRIVGSLNKCSTATGGYCKARQRLPLEMVCELTRYVGLLVDEKTPSHWRWLGRTVRLIDGTTVTLPDTQDNQSRYPQISGQKAGLGFPICRLVGLVCLSSGVLLDAAFGPLQGKGGDEQSLAREMLDSFKPKDVVVGDAFYGTYFFLAKLKEKRVDAVFEQYGARKRSCDFRKGKRIGAKDHLIEIKKPIKRPDWMSEEEYEQAPDTLLVRECKIGHKIYVTTFLNPNEVSKHEIKKLYKDRWHIELDFRNIKTTLGMETLSCKTPQMCEKEIWVYLLAYNLIRLLMAQSASLVDLLPRQLSFKHTVQLWAAWNSHGSHREIAELFLLIGENQVGNRPGRIEPRALKRRPKAFPMLMERRELARERVKLHGHTKKLK